MKCISLCVMRATKTAFGLQYLVRSAAGGLQGRSSVAVPVYHFGPASRSNATPSRRAMGPEACDPGPASSVASYPSDQLVEPRPVCSLARLCRPMVPTVYDRIHEGVFV